MNKTRNKRLFKAIEDADLTTVETIFEKNPDEIDIYGISNRYCRDKTPLMFAMQCENFELSRYLILRGANVNARMAGGPKMSVLALAAKFGHGLNPQYEAWIEFASELISVGANPTDGLWSALVNYVDDQAGMIKLLVENGADLDSEIPAGIIRDLIKVNRHLYSGEVLKLCGVKDS